MKGDFGDKGDRGYSPPKGRRGIPGDEGPKGPSGDRGPRGSTVPGFDGRTGFPGDDGEQGPNGPRGADGRRGLPGIAVSNDASILFSKSPICQFNFYTKTIFHDINLLMKYYFRERKVKRD